MCESCSVGLRKFDGPSPMYIRDLPLPSKLENIILVVGATSKNIQNQKYIQNGNEKWTSKFPPRTNDAKESQAYICASFSTLYVYFHVKMQETNFIFSVF